MWWDGKFSAIMGQRAELGDGAAAHRLSKVLQGTQVDAEAALAESTGPAHTSPRAAGTA